MRCWCVSWPGGRAKSGMGRCQDSEPFLSELASVGRIELGLTVDEIAAALVAELRLRPRAAYRYAVGMSGQAAADVYNAKFGTAQSPAPMSKTRISEYENWPIGRSTRRPSATVLQNLAVIYRTSPANLLDHRDLEALGERQRQCLLAPGAEPGAAVEHSVVRTADRAGLTSARENRTDDPCGVHVPPRDMASPDGRTADHDRSPASRRPRWP